MQIGDNIRLRRMAKGLTQAELGRLSGLTHAAICHYERGKRKPCMAALLALAKALGCTVEELVGGAASA